MAVLYRIQPSVPCSPRTLADVMLFINRIFNISKQWFNDFFVTSSMSTTSGHYIVDYLILKLSRYRSEINSSKETGGHLVGLRSLRHCVHEYLKY